MIAPSKRGVILRGALYVGIGMLATAIQYLSPMAAHVCTVLLIGMSNFRAFIDTSAGDQRAAEEALPTFSAIPGYALAASNGTMVPAAAAPVLEGPPAEPETPQTTPP